MTGSGGSWSRARERGGPGGPIPYGGGGGGGVATRNTGPYIYIYILKRMKVTVPFELQGLGVNPLASLVSSPLYKGYVQVVCTRSMYKRPSTLKEGAWRKMVSGVSGRASWC